MSTLILQPDATTGIDTWIVDGNPTANNGVSTEIGAGKDGIPNTYRGLLKFDLSAVPVGSLIQSAILTLNCAAEDSSSDEAVKIHRSLVAWFEGTKNLATPGAGENASTWNLRNNNGSVAWAGGVGGAAGSDWVSSATATTTITSTGLFTWDLTVDVTGFVNGSLTNNGWWILGTTTTSGRKRFNSSDSASTTLRPKITITYVNPVTGNSAGNSTATATLKARGNLSGLAIGSSIITGNAFSNAVQGSITGTSTVTGALGASGRGFVTIVGTSTASAVIHGKTHLTVSIFGISSLSADGSFAGLLRGAISGLGILTATGFVLSLNIITGKGCYSDPLLFITDGSLQTNNQLNLLNLIDPKIGFLLDDWKPAISQYKDGGTFSDSPNSTGRSLVKRIFANSIEVFTFSVRGHDEDDLIWYIQQLLSWQEAAADYWTSDNPFLPVYIGAKAAKETNIRYAAIKAMSSPQSDNPYAQPFALRNDTAVIDNFTLRLERGDWMSNPPGQSECVAISSQRAWTIAGWSVP